MGAEPQVIGIAGPLSGERSIYGKLLLDAIQSTPCSCDVLLGDDMANPQVAVEVARGFVEAGVDAVIGHFNSDCARVAGKIYSRHAIAFLMPASTSMELVDETGRFRLCAADEAQVEIIAQ